MFGILLTNLSKVFDCLSHELLAAKLSTYGVDFSVIRLIYDYLTNRKRKLKIENHYSLRRDLFFGVPQGSILGPLLFKFYHCDLFMFAGSIDIAS